LQNMVQYILLLSHLKTFGLVNILLKTNMRFAVLLAALACFILINQVDARPKKGSKESSESSSESGSKSVSKSGSGSCECEDGTTGTPIRLQETERKKKKKEKKKGSSESCSCETAADADVIAIGVITAAPGSATPIRVSN